MRVLEAVEAPGDTLKFINQIVDFAPDSVSFSFFSWRRVLLSSYDVIHFHWPEHLIRDVRPIRRFVKRSLFRILLARLRLQRLPVVRTVHNVSPHTPGDQEEERLLAALDRQVTEHVVLNECTPRGSDQRATLIRHAHYRDRFEAEPREESIPGRLLFLGRIEPYKGLLELIDTVTYRPAGVNELRIVGKPVPDLVASLSEAIDRGAEAFPISARLTYVTDTDMVKEVTAAEALVLPYREMHNSGVMLVALSLARPVIVPRSCTTTMLAEEVGAGWVIEYDGPLTDQVLADAMDDLRSHDRAIDPVLDTRDWLHVANAYAAVFTSALR
ncbi:glycosyl transferase [Microbacterium sp. P01]|uniref:glycosyl transferase n=1 Tax=unclassified Microbacterium TaxID=2609290 RepID=UPI00366F59FB